MYIPENPNCPSEAESTLLDLTQEIYLGVYSLIALGWHDYSPFVLFGFNAEELAEDRKEKPTSQVVEEMVSELSKIIDALEVLKSQSFDKKRRHELRLAKSWAVKAQYSLQALKPLVDLWQDPNVTAKWRMYQAGKNPVDPKGRPMFSCQRNSEWPWRDKADRCLECIEGLYKWINRGQPLDILF